MSASMGRIKGIITLRIRTEKFRNSMLSIIRAAGSDGISQTELARRMARSRRSIGNHVESLVAESYVSYHKSVGKNVPYRYYSITDKHYSAQIETYREREEVEKQKLSLSAPPENAVIKVNEYTTIYGERHPNYSLRKRDCGIPAGSAYLLETF